MDIKNVNINNLYSAVRNVGANDTQILEPLGGGGWQISQAKDLTPEQKAQNRKFRNGLYDSLKGMTSDDSVINDLRNALGLPEKANENEDKKADADKPLMARDIKKAIELVMRRVDERIDAVLTTKFPPAVQQLIREAVRENPQHAIVKAFLRAEKGSVDDLAKLCRLTFQCMKGAADPSVLAYLDGFAYKVEDFTDVSLVHAHDKAQYDAGKAHYDSEVKKNEVKDDKVKNDENEDNKDSDSEVKDDKIKNNEVKDDKNSNSENTKVKVKKEQESSDEIKKAKQYHKLTMIEEEEEVCSADTILKKTEKLDKVNDKNVVVKNDENKGNKDSNIKLKKSEIEVEELIIENANNESEELDFADFCQQFEKTVGKEIKEADKFVEWMRKDDNIGFYKFFLSVGAEECKSAALDKDTAQAVFIEAMLKEFAKKAKLNPKKEDWPRVFEEACVEASHDFCRAQTLGYAVQKCDKEITKLKNAVQQAQSGGNTFQKEVLESLSKDVEDLKNKSGNVYTALCETFKSATTKFDGLENKVEEVRKSVSEKLRSIIEVALNQKGLDNLKGANPQNVILMDKYNERGEYTKNAMLLQGSSQLCYLRSIENALIAQGRDLPVPDKKGTYKFELEFSTSKENNSVTFKRAISVTRQEINEARRLYEKGMMETVFEGCSERYTDQKNALQDLDVAINIAMAKRARVNDRLEKQGVNVAQKCPLDLGSNGLTDKGFADMLNCFDLTASNYDHEVADFFGLTQRDDIAINYDWKPENKNGVAVESRKKDIVAKFVRLQNWMEEHPNGILTLNEAKRHYVTITGCYRNSDDDFGFVVRDSNKKDGVESTINVLNYHYDGELKNDEDMDKKCHTLNVHCYEAPPEVKN